MSILRLGIAFEKPLRYPDFDTKVLKSGLRGIGKEIAKTSRKLVSRRGISRKGDYPAMQTGGLAKAIKYKTSRSGFSVAVKSDPSGMPVYYPAFVYYGHRGPGRDSKKQRGTKRHGRKVAAPRANWIVDAAERYGRYRYMAEMKQIMAQAIKPGLIQGVVTK